jgi:large subunit ribosomal protein L23
MIKPILTEKGLNEAKKGKYSFYVDPGLNKFQIKEVLSKLFGVHVINVKTANLKGTVKRDYKGKYKKIMGKKKAIVTLKGKETIDLIDSKK